jgi:hypothetical protein
MRSRGAFLNPYAILASDEHNQDDSFYLGLGERHYLSATSDGKKAR